MRPNSYMNWCRRKAKCRWCEKEIPVATPTVTTFYWNTRSGGSWNVKQHYHPDCWLKNCMDYLERNPYTPGLRRGPKVKFIQEDRKERLKLLQAKAALEQRKRRLLSLPEENSNKVKLGRIESKILNLYDKISRLGGIPKGWLIN